jgi:hypothetical protein
MTYPLPARLVLTTAVLCLLAAGDATAELRTRLFYGSPILGIANSSPVLVSQTGPLTDDYYFDGAGPHGSGRLDAESEVEYGVIRAQAIGNINAGDFDTSQVSMDSGLNGEGSFSDFVTINAAGRTGTQGKFVARIRVTGSASATAFGEDLPFTSFSEAGWLVTVGPGSQQLFGTCNAYHGEGPACAYSGDDFGTHTLAPIPFIFGSPFTLSVALSAGTFLRTVPDGSTSVNLNLFSTLAWMGIQEVTDEGGTPIASYSLTSDSQTDWALPLPEPGAALGALASLTTLAILARHKPRA